jgi:voltage-gated potassium channel
MAANPTTKNKTAVRPARELTTYDLAIGILAIFSLILLVLIYFVPLSSATVDVLNSLENALCIVFLFDFFRSLRLAPNKWDYFLKGGGWLDLLGSIPYNKLAIFRVARLFRVVRLLRKVSGGQLRHIITRRLAQSTLLFTLVAALLLVFAISGIVLYAEHGTPHANIKTYHDAVWWAFVTITTVGYGDYYPVTTLGESAAVILMFVGLGIIGVLSSYLATTFISFERGESERRAGENKHSDDKEHDVDEPTTNLEAELAAMKEKLATIQQLLEQHYQA